MKSFLVFFLIIAFAHSDLLDDDKQILKNAGKLQDSHKNTDAEKITIPNTTTDKTADRKLKEHEDHHEMQTMVEEPKISVTPTPSSVKLILDETEDAGDSKQEMPNAMTNSSLVPAPEKVDRENGADFWHDPDDMKVPSTKKPIKGRKGVNYNSPISPRKEAPPEMNKPSVVPRKEAPPEMNKPSVVPRKEADLSKLQTSNDTFLLTTTISPIKDTQITGEGTPNKSMAPELNMPPVSQIKSSSTPKYPEAKMDFTSTSANEKPVSVITPTPINNSVPSSELPIAGEPVKPLISVPSTTKETISHMKPTAAIASAGSKLPSGDDMSYTPAVIGVVLLVIILVTIIVVGYRRLQDVWMRRHYARMDFLIDGMYDV